MSNRKSGKSKDDGVVFEGIAEVKTGIKQNNFRTLGEYLHTLDKNENIIPSVKWLKLNLKNFGMPKARFIPKS